MKALLCITATLLSVTFTSLVQAESCGNLQAPTNPPDPCGNSGGANLFNPLTGSVSREIIDLKLPASIGERPLHFTRLSTSRYLGGLPTPLGPSGNWRHNYLWKIRFLGFDDAGEARIAVDYPNGSSWEFQFAQVGDPYMTATARTHDRIEKDSDRPGYYRLWRKDGSRLEFYMLGSGTETRFLPLAEYDKHNRAYTYTHDAMERLTRVTDPAGHFIQLNYGPIGNFSTAFVEFNYHNPDAQTVSLAGSFNGWDTTAHPMIRSEAGNWQLTLPLQAGTSLGTVTHQYKFVIDGSTWISDPANPHTFPEGGPESGNNSLLTLDYDADHLDYQAVVPVRFEIEAPQAQSVRLAGSFNGWQGDAHPLQRDGDRWVLEFELAPGNYTYKYIVDSDWITDPENPFREPDGYGGYNSRLAVGPRQEAITHVQTSDGRALFYDYTIYEGTATLYAALTAVNYTDDHQARYTYSTTYQTGVRPHLASADDPRYDGRAGARIAYEYRPSGVAGFIAREKNLLTGETLVELQAEGETLRRLVSGSRVEVLTYNGIQLLSRKFLTPEDPEDPDNQLEDQSGRAYFDNNFGMLESTTDALGHTTRYERTWDFGILKKTTLPDGSSRALAFTDDRKPFHLASETDALGRITRYQRDPNGLPTRIDHPDGSYETFTYNTFGQPLTHRLRNGGTESFSYSPDGLRLSHTDPMGGVTTFTHDATGRLASRTDPLGRTTTYSYNARGQKIKETHPDDSFREWDYDPYGLLLFESDENGATTLYTYDDYGRRTYAIDPLGRATQFTYHGGINGCGACGFREQPDQIISPEGHLTEYTYDPKGRRLTETRAAGTPLAATTQFTYDLAGRLTAKTDPLGNAWSYTYDNRGRRLTESDPLGHRTTYTYDAVGNTLTRTLPGDTAWSMTYNAMNRRLTTTDPLGHTTRQTYDFGGRLTSETDALGRITSYRYNNADQRVVTVHPDGSSTQQSFDAAGNLTQRTDPLGRITQFLYDNRNRLVTVANPLGEQFDYAYDSTGRRLAEMFPGGLTRHQSYDAAGKLTETILALDTDDETRTTYTYDGDGYRLSETDPLGHTTTYTYDALGHRTTLRSPLGLTTTYTYDANGNSLTETRPDGSSLTRTYDPHGRRLSETDPAGDTLQYSYTPRGALASLTDTRGAVTTFSYDALDRRTAKTYDDGSAEQSSYDAAGQLITFTTARGLTRTYTYDLRGQLTGVTYSDATPAVSYTYDAAGQRLSASNAHATIEYRYDGAGRPAGETQTLAGHPLGARRFDLSHNVDARLTRIDYPGTNAPTLNYSYSPRGQLASVATPAFNVAYTRRPDERITALHYSNGIRNTREYDADGRLLATRYYRGEATTPFSQAAYTLDALGRRTALQRADGAGDTFHYDAKDQLTGAGYEVPGADPVNTPQSTATFAYDSMGNRTRFEDRSHPATSYTANALNQYTAVSAFNTTPTYDSDGNLTRREDQRLTWNAENRLLRVEPALPKTDDQRVRYAYDPLGRRVRRSVDTFDGNTWSQTKDTHYSYWDWHVIETHTVQASAPSKTRRYVWGEDLSGSSRAPVAWGDSSPWNPPPGSGATTTTATAMSPN